MPACYEELDLDLLLSKAATFEEQFSGDYERIFIKPNRPALENQFSSAELAVMDAVAEQFRYWTGSQLRDYSHKEPGYMTTELGEVIPYAAALVDKDGVTEDDIRWANAVRERYAGPHDPKAAWVRELQPEELSEEQAAALDELMAGPGDRQRDDYTPLKRGDRLTRIRP